MFAEIQIDPATVTTAIFAAVTWLLGISYFLGRYTSKVDRLSEALPQIFSKLDELGRSLPHVCGQTAIIAKLEQEMGEKRRRLDSLEHWREEIAFHVAGPKPETSD